MKISTLLLFARIFPNTNFRRILWAVGLFISIYSAIMVITVIFQCRPIERIWDSEINAECIDISKLWMVMASLNVVTDFIIVCLPLPQLWELQMPRGTKLQLIGIFSIGSLYVYSLTSLIEAMADCISSATIISIYRIPQLRWLSLDSYDPTWSDVGASLWSFAEISAIAVGASAITYRPLFNWLFKIQPPSAASGIRTTRAGATKQSGTNPGIASHSNDGGDIKMQVRKVFQSPLSSLSTHDSRIVETEDGFRRIRDLIEA